MTKLSNLIDATSERQPDSEGGEADRGGITSWPNPYPPTGRQVTGNGIPNPQHNQIPEDLVRSPENSRNFSGEPSFLLIETRTTVSVIMGIKLQIQKQLLSLSFSHLVKHQAVTKMKDMEAFKAHTILNPTPKTGIYDRVRKHLRLRLVPVLWDGIKIQILKQSTNRKRGKLDETAYLKLPLLLSELLSFLSNPRNTSLSQGPRPGVDRNNINYSPSFNKILAKVTFPKILTKYHTRGVGFVFTYISWWLLLIYTNE